MFGSKKSHDVRLTDEELKRITGNMTKAERKDFERRQRQAENDRMWDAMIMGELFRDDENE